MPGPRHTWEFADEYGKKLRCVNCTWEIENPLYQVNTAKAWSQAWTHDYSCADHLHLIIERRVREKQLSEPRWLLSDLPPLGSVDYLPCLVPQKK